MTILSTLTDVPDSSKRFNIDATEAKDTQSSRVSLPTSVKNVCDSVNGGDKETEGNTCSLPCGFFQSHIANLLSYADYLNAEKAFSSSEQALMPIAEMRKKLAENKISGDLKKECEKRVAEANFACLSEEQLDLLKNITIQRKIEFHGGGITVHFGENLTSSSIAEIKKMISTLQSLDNLFDFSVSYSKWGKYWHGRDITLGSVHGIGDDGSGVERLGALVSKDLALVILLTAYAQSEGFQTALLATTLMKVYDTLDEASLLKPEVRTVINIAKQFI